MGHHATTNGRWARPDWEAKREDERSIAGPDGDSGTTKALGLVADRATDPELPLDPQASRARGLQDLAPTRGRRSRKSRLAGDDLDHADDDGSRHRDVGPRWDRIDDDGRKLSPVMARLELAELLLDVPDQFVLAEKPLAVSERCQRLLGGGDLLIREHCFWRHVEPPKYSDKECTVINPEDRSSLLLVYRSLAHREQPGSKTPTESRHLLHYTWGS